MCGGKQCKYIPWSVDGRHRAAGTSSLFWLQRWYPRVSKKGAGGCTFHGRPLSLTVTCRKSFGVTGAILLRRFRKMSCSFRGRRSTLDVSIVILRGKRSALDVSCCVFFANRIVRAASSGDKVQIPWQALHFVRCDENWRNLRTKHRFCGSKSSGSKENSLGKRRF